MVEDESQKYAEGSLGAHILRRAMHCALSLAIIYYLLPLEIYGLKRVYVMIILLIGVPTVVEVLRLKAGMRVYGLRDHEANAVASYYWFITGSAVLFLIFPQQIAVPVLVAVSFGDPIIGETRHLRRRYWFTIGALSCTVPFLIYGYHPALAVFSGAVTFLAESVELSLTWKLRDSVFQSRSRGTMTPWARYFRFMFHFDDDLIMQLIPAITLLLIYYNIPGIFPEPWIKPIFPHWP